MKLTFFKGTILGLVSGSALGLAGVGYATSYGVNPHHNVNAACLNSLEHLMRPSDIGAALHLHFPQGNALKHASGSSLSNSVSGKTYTSFLTFLDDVRLGSGLARLTAMQYDASGNPILLDQSGAPVTFDSLLGEHVMEGLCVS